MSDPRLFEGDHYVVLEPDRAEQFLTIDQLRGKLTDVLRDRQADLPSDIRRFDAIADQVQYLIDTSCEFDLGPGEFLQWYVVRLDKAKGR